MANPFRPLHLRAPKSRRINTCTAPITVDSKPLTPKLSPLSATLTKNMGGREQPDTPPNANSIVVTSEPQRKQIPALASLHRAVRRAPSESSYSRASDGRDSSVAPQTVAGRDQSRSKYP